MASVPEDARKRPVRLLIASKVLSLHPVQPYELVPKDTYVDMAFDEFISTGREKTGVVSWRWARPKPSSLDEARAITNETTVVPLSLLAHCDELAKQDPSLEYIWLDWPCVPQYAKDPSVTMAEINRSGLFYATCRRMIVWCFNSVDTKKLTADYSTYFTRAWTLAERLHRMNGTLPLELQSFLPSYLQPSSTSCIFTELRATRANALLGEDHGEMALLPWHRTISTLTSKVSDFQTALKASNEQASNEAIDEVGKLLLSRYGQLARAAKIVDDQINQLGDMSPTLLLRVSLAVRAFGEWLRPHPEEEGMYRIDAASVYDMYDTPFSRQLFPYHIKVHLLANWLKSRHKQMDNVKQAGNKVSQLVYDAYLAAEKAASEATANPPSAEKKAELALEVCTTSLNMWKVACEHKLTEVVDEAWLAKYLVYDVGVRYVAFEPRDLLFAIKGLFRIHTAAGYEAAPEVWDGLAALAGIDRGEPYSWMRNLSRPSPNQSLSTHHVVLVRQEDAAKFHGCCARKFGVYGEDLSDLAERVHTSIAKSFVEALTLSGTSGDSNFVADDRFLASFFVGARLSHAAIKKLGDGSLPLQTVDLTGINNLLSLRGQMAMKQLQDRIHATLREVARSVDGVEGKNKALFVVARHHTFDGHGRVFILCCASAGETGWVPLAVASVGGTPMKGGIVAFSRVVSCLAKSFTAVAGAQRVGLQYMTGEDVIASGGAAQEVSSLPSAFEGQKQAWWTRPLSLSSQLPSAEDGEEEEEAADEEGDAEEQEGGVKSEEEALAILAGYRPGTRTSCTDDDLKIVEAAFYVNESQGTAEAAQLYGNVLASNRMMDREMAEHLGYFTKYANILAAHVVLRPDLAKCFSRRFDEFCEDFDDAIGMASDEEKSAHEQAARGAVGVLKQMCDAEDIF